MLTHQIEVASRPPESGIHARLRRFVQENALYRQRRLTLADDSTYVANILAFVEGEFGVRISINEITEQNFGSVSAIARFIAGKRSLAHGDRAMSLLTCADQ